MRRRAFLRSGAGAISLSAVAPTAGARTRAAVTQSEFAPLGRVDVPGAAEAVVGDGGETVFLAALDGFAAVDVTDPSDPALLADRRQLSVDDTPLRDILDVEVDGDRLVVPAPANQLEDDVFRGFLLYDVSDPADPVRVGEPYETGYHIHNCFFADELLYVAANGEEENSLVVFDVSDDDPAEIGRWSLLEHEPGWADHYWFARYLHDVYVHDDIAYLPFWDAGTYLLDVSDPADPTFVSRVIDADLEEQRRFEDEEAQLGLPGNDHYSAVDDAGDLLAVGREAWATGGEEPDGPGGIDLYDVSDPAEPEFRASIDAPPADDAGYFGGEWTTAHNFELRDGRLYSSWYVGGVKVHDVSDPSSPTELDHWSDRDEASFFTARVAEPGEFFVASSTSLVPRTDIEGALYTFPTDVAETEDGLDDEGLADSIPGFGGLAGAAGLAGGTVALEWLRRRQGAKPTSDGE